MYRKTFFNVYAFLGLALVVGVVAGRRCGRALLTGSITPLPPAWQCEQGRKCGCAFVSGGIEGLGLRTEAEMTTGGGGMMECFSNGENSLFADAAGRTHAVDSASEETWLMQIEA